MITYTNQINTIIDKVINILGDEISVPIRRDQHKGNHSIVVSPIEDNLVELLANGQTREYSMIISYELNITTLNKNTFKQISNMAEHLKQLFSMNNYANVTDYWFGGNISNVVYEQNEEGKMNASLTFNCMALETN